NGQSYLDLYSDPSMTSHINFGVVKDASGNNIGPKWHFSSRTASDNDEFRFYRGSGLGGYDYILTFTGSGTNANRITFTRPEESTSTTNGSVVFNGGVGIQKTLNVKDIGCNTINSSTIDTSLLTVTGLTTNKLIGVGTG